MSYVMRVSLVNEDQGYRFSDFDEQLDNFYDPDVLDDDGMPNMGAIYRVAQREFGRCMSRVYVDREGNRPATIGWYFVKRERYEDTGKPYLRGAWVTVGETVPSSFRYFDSEGE